MKLRDNNAFRFWAFIGLPLLIITLSCFFPSNYYVQLVNLLGINIILVASLNLVNGFSGMFSMGHAAFMAVGAYISAYCTIPAAEKASQMPGLPPWLLDMTLPFPVVLLLAGIGAMIVAAVIGFPVLRFKGHYLSVATLGLIVIVRAVLDNSDAYTNGARGLTGLDYKYASTWVIYLVVVITLFVLFRILRSSYGRSLIAMRDDPTAAQTLGVSLTKSKLMSFAISAFFAGVGGALWGHMQTVISGKFFYYEMSFKIVETSIIGGMFTLSGSIVGSIIMTLLPELLAPIESGFSLFGLKLPVMYGVSNLILAAFLVVMIIFRRQGIVGYSERIVESLFSKDTWRSVFKKSEYKQLGTILSDKYKTIQDFIKKRGRK